MRCTAGFRSRKGRIGIALRLGGAVDGTQTVQLSASSRELLAQFGHLVPKPASPQSIELHSIPPARAGLQDIELAGSSQRGIHACSRSDVDCAIARTADYEGASRIGSRDRIS